MTYFYEVYGLRIALTQPLSLLTQTTTYSDFDVSIDLSNRIRPELSRLFQRPPDTSKDGIKVCHTKHWVCIDCPRSADHTLRFYVSRDGTQVISHKPDAIPDSDIESFILGPILGCVLRLRNQVCLHASVLEYDGKVLALVGNKGAGKSTTAAALLQAGACLVSDDIAVLHCTDKDTLTVYPGYPAVRLMPEVLSKFGLNQHDYDPVVSTTDKRVVPIPVSKSGSTTNNAWKFQSQAHQLSAIYLLEARLPKLSSNKITKLTGQKAFIAIAPHGYARQAQSENQLDQEFAFMSEMIRRTPIKSVHRPDNLECLPQLAIDILDDLADIA